MQILPAIAVDVICILVFAIVGRSSHQEATDLLGVAHTIWPFLAGCLLGTLIGRTWRHPYALTSGVAVWLGTVIGGMTLRVLTGGGVQLSFIVVASCVLALFIIGWRAGLGLIQRARAKPPSPSTNLVSTYPRGRRTAFPEQPRSEILTNRASAKRASEFRERRNRVAPS